MIMQPNDVNELKMDMLDCPDKLYIGVDVGKSGGIAFIYLDKMYCFKMPDNPHDLVKLFKNIVDTAPDINKFCVVEKVWSMPKQGVKSMFTFGYNYGLIIATISSLSIPYVEVIPNSWMKWFGSMPKDKSERKKHIKALAFQRYPTNNNITLKTSDAIMIATYCKENYK